MAVSVEFQDYILEMLEPLGAPQAKRMFGGAGLYLDGTIFAVMSDDALFLKVDDHNRPDFEAEGMGPFDPFDDDKRLIRSYYECPARLLEEADELTVWAKRAWEAGRRADADKSKRSKRKTAT